MSSGQEVIVTARIVNDGLGPARSFEVDFYNDDEIFQTVEISNQLPSNEATNIQAKWIAEEGNHILKAIVKQISPQDADTSNQEIQINVQVDSFIDSQSPMVFITEPYQNEVVSDLVVVKGTANDDNNIVNVEVRVSPNDWENANGFEEWVWMWNTTQDLNGRYTLEARSFDGFNYSPIYSVDVEVTNDGANRRPTASIKADVNELYIGDKIVFSGNSSSDDSAISKYQFNFGDSKETGWLTDSWVEYYYEEAGEYEVKLQVEDDEGIQSSSADSIMIKVIEKAQNSKPIAVISSPLMDSIYQSNSNIQFSAQGSFDSDGDELFFTWSSSIDGQFYETSLLFFQFPLSEGVHIITLTVSDPYLLSDSVSTQITVTVSDDSFDEQDPILSSLGILPTTVILVLVTFFIRRRI
jgi:PKD repeat protein